MRLAAPSRPGASLRPSFIPACSKPAAQIWHGQQVAAPLRGEQPCRAQHAHQRTAFAAAAGSAHAASNLEDSVAAPVESAPADDSDPELAAAAVAAVQPDADIAERQRLLARAKQQLAQLRAAQSATGRAAATPARQPPTAAAAPSSPQQQEAPALCQQAPQAGTASAAASAGGSRGVMAARTARQKKQAVVSASAAWAPVQGSAPAFPPKSNPRRVKRSTETVDAQRYEQVVASRNRLAAQLSGANRYTAHLEAELKGRSADVSAAAGSLSQVSAQLGQLLRTAGLAAGEAPAGPDTAQGYALAQQLARLQQQIQQHTRRLEDSAVHPVPLVWVGVAQEVRLMGSFDGWSRGVALSSAGDAGDSVFHRFEGTLHARKGEYIVKFQVDGAWRLAPHWPTRDDAAGATNNVLRID